MSDCCWFCWWSVFFFFSLSLPLSLGLCCNVCEQRRETDRGWTIRRRPPFYHYDYGLSCVLGLNTKHCPGRSVVSRLSPPPTSSCGPLKQGPREEVAEQAALSRRCCFGRSVMQMSLCSAPVKGGNAVRIFVANGSACLVSFLALFIFLGLLFGTNFWEQFFFGCCGLVLQSWRPSQEVPKPRPGKVPKKCFGKFRSETGCFGKCRKSAPGPVSYTTST